MSAPYLVIYDGLCNLCSGLVAWLQKLDHQQLFTYLPMQDPQVHQLWGIPPGGCELGMILIDQRDPQRRWQGSGAAEEIARLLPGGQVLVDIYRAVPGLKALGDHCYVQIRDHRYQWFGRRPEVYQVSER
ncbi:MAG: DCC1-like thiol-disulfide oxidoreductase family protein [Thermostichales cyanobacterium SZTDM-1c_bins_54]